MSKNIDEVNSFVFYNWFDNFVLAVLKFECKGKGTFRYVYKTALYILIFLMLRKKELLAKLSKFTK